jgi:hypothetical protein
MENHERSMLERSHRIVLGNGDDLMACLSRAAVPDVALRMMSLDATSDEVEAFLDDVDRLLENYTTSLYALERHLDRFKGDSDCRKVALRLLRAESVEFVFHLRRFGTHERPPLAVAQLGFASLAAHGAGPPFPMSFGPVLIRGDLDLSNRAPKARARAFMDRYTDEIPVLDVVAESGAAVEASLETLNGT